MVVRYEAGLSRTHQVLPRLLDQQSISRRELVEYVIMGTSTPDLQVDVNEL